MAGLLKISDSALQIGLTAKIIYRHSHVPCLHWYADRKSIWWLKGIQQVIFAAPFLFCCSSVLPANKDVGVENMATKQDGEKEGEGCHLRE